MMKFVEKNHGVDWHLIRIVNNLYDGKRVYLKLGVQCSRGYFSIFSFMEGLDRRMRGLLGRE